MSRPVTFSDYFSVSAKLRAQPRWARLLYIIVGVSAFAVFVFSAFLSNLPGKLPVIGDIAFGLFACVAAIMTVNHARVLFRGHWDD